MRPLKSIPDGVPRQAFTIREFCEAHRISRTALYKHWEAGTGPRRMHNGTKNLISVEAAADWRREREEAEVRQQTDRRAGADVTANVTAVR
jgi:hypothetical protein